MTRLQKILLITAIIAVLSNLLTFTAHAEKACTPGKDCPVWCTDKQDPKKDGCRRIKTLRDLFPHNS